MEADHQRETRIEAYMRAYTPVSQPQNEVITRLDVLQQHDRIDDYDVTYVPKSVQRGSQTEAERLYETFLQWADDAGLSVERPFEVQHYENPITGETVDKLVTPIVCIAVYEDDAVEAVFPCEDGDDHVTVLDALDAMQHGDDPLAALAVDSHRERVAVADD
jgi:hypothetical protein